MQKIIILLLAFFLAKNCFAQVEFATNGATWRYTEGNGSFSGYTSGTTEYKYSGDSILLGKKCKKFFKTYLSNKNGAITSSTEKTPYLIYQDGKKIYRLVGNNFQLAYDFSAKIGDTILIKNGTSYYYKMLITNIINEKIGNDTLKKFQYKLFCTSGALTSSTHFYQEKIGFLKERLFPDNVLPCVSDGNPTGQIRCYKDNATTEILLDKTYPCDYVPLVSTFDHVSNSAINVFADKINKKLRLTFEENTEVNRFVLFDIKGSLIIDNQIINANNSYDTNIEDLPEGIYFWQVFSNKKLIKSGKVLY